MRPKFLSYLHNLHSIFKEKNRNDKKPEYVRGTLIDETATQPTQSGVPRNYTQSLARTPSRCLLCDLTKRALEYQSYFPLCLAQSKNGKEINLVSTEIKVPARAGDKTFGQKLIQTNSHLNRKLSFIFKKLSMSDV